MTEQDSGTARETEHDFVGVDDGFERLWTPHRMAYIVGDKSSSSGARTVTWC